MAKELLFSLTKKDFILQTFRCSGPGGQHVNKVETGVRITHPDSGAVGQSCTHKSQIQNRKEAFNRLIQSPKFKVWHGLKIKEILDGKTIEQVVEEQMQEKNLKVEIFKDGQWRQENEI